MHMTVSVPGPSIDALTQLIMFLLLFKVAHPPLEILLTWPGLNAHKMGYSAYLG